MSLLTFIELSAVVSSAVFGILRACRKQFDVVGIFAISFAIAFGGGTLRDLFLNRHPLFWIAKDHYVAIVLGLAVLGSIAPRFILRFEKWLPIPDAVGLALFSITGAAYGMEAGTSMLIAAMLGVVTGTFGGVIADVICNEIPSLFRSAPLYATCSFTGVWVYLLMERAGLPSNAAVVGGFMVIFLFRLAALKWNLRLPNASLDH